VLVTLVALAEFEKRLPRGGHDSTLTLTSDDRPGGLGQVGSALGARGVDIRDLQLRPAGQAGQVRVEMVVRLPLRVDLVELTGALAALEAVRGVELGE
jgi:acetolactate synthase regulatory subunit